MNTVDSLIDIIVEYKVKKEALTEKLKVQEYIRVNWDKLVGEERVRLWSAQLDEEIKTLNEVIATMDEEIATLAEKMLRVKKAEMEAVEDEIRVQSAEFEALRVKTADLETEEEQGEEGEEEDSN
jgi:hypothetical protein